MVKISPESAVMYLVGAHTRAGNSRAIDPSNLELEATYLQTELDSRGLDFLVQGTSEELQEAYASSPIEQSQDIPLDLIELIEDAADSAIVLGKGE